MGEHHSLNRNMKILEVIDWFPPGHHAGDSILARAFCNELHSLGHQVLVLTKKKAVRATHIDVEGRWKTLPYPVIRVTESNGYIEPAVDSFDVVHVHQVSGLEILNEVKIPANIPVIYHCHIDYLPLIDMDVDLGFEVHEYLEMQKLMLERAAGIICHSGEVKASLATQGYQETKIDIINPIVDLGRGRKKKPGTSHGLVVAVGGRLEDDLKGFSGSIRAIQGVMEKTDNKICLLVIGTYLDEQKEEAEKRLGENVEFVGWITRRVKLQKQLSRADVFLSLSKSETFGLMILEAVSMGTVPICTSVGEVAKKIKAFGAGIVLLADVNNEDAVIEETTEALSQLVKERTRLKDFIKQGQALCGLYEPRHVTLELEKILRKYI